MSKSEEKVVEKICDSGMKPICEIDVYVAYLLWFIDYYTLSDKDIIVLSEYEDGRMGISVHPDSDNYRSYFLDQLRQREALAEFLEGK